MNFTLKDESIVFKTPEECDCCRQTIWCLDSLKEIKCQLNEVKCLLNDYDLNEWSTHTKNTDRSSMVIETMRRQLSRRPYLLTKAWLKMYEILCEFRPLEAMAKSGSDGRLHCLLLCECPGSFVNAINHYIVANGLDVSLQWMANTLNPYYEDIDHTIIDDKFIKDVNAYHKWFFGSTNTGDILDVDFVRDLRHEMSVRDVEAFHLITCDGSVNCVDCPEAQEEVVQPLIAREVLISLEVIAEMGCLVVKCFTLFECQTLCLLYLLCCAFDRIHVFKPNGSKAGNSEIYLICIGFHSTEQLKTILSTIWTNYGSVETKALFSRQSLSQQFLDNVEKCLNYFIKNQIIVIKDNLKTFKAIPDRHRQQMMNERKNFAKKLIKKLNIFSISRFDELVNDCDDDSVADRCLRFPKLNQLLVNNSSYSQRKRNDFFADMWFERLSKLLSQMSERIDFRNQLIECKLWKQNTECNAVNVRPVYGLTYKRITNSKFCDLSLIISYNKCMTFEDRFANIGQSFVSFGCETKQILQTLVNELERDVCFDRLVVMSCGESCDNYSKQLKELSLNKSLQIITDVKRVSKSGTTLRDIYFINAFKAFRLDLIEEKSSLSELMKHFLQINAFIREKHLLIIEIGFSLTRLMTATLHMISQLFDSFSIVPCIGTDGNGRHGLLCLFYSKRERQTQLNEEIVANLSSLSTTLLNESKESRHSLVEVISVPQLMSDLKFCETLYNGNCVQMIELLRIMSTIVTN